MAITGVYWEGGAVTQPCLSDLNDHRLGGLSDSFQFLKAFDPTYFSGDFDQNGTADRNNFFGFLNACYARCRTSAACRASVTGRFHVGRDASATVRFVFFPRRCANIQRFLGMGCL